MAKPLVAMLAAGRSTRFGGIKLEAPCAGKPLGRWAVEAAESAGLKPGVIVTGPERVSFARGWTRLTNPHPEQGLGTSLAIAAQHALDEGAETMIVMLADMPLVIPALLKVLAEAPAPMAFLYPRGGPGVPALLDRRLITAAASLTGDRGLGPMLRDVPALPAGTMLFDVDTPGDLAEAERRLLGRLATEPDHPAR
jgi:molybdenum cofactor cytidylyltransferase